MSETLNFKFKFLSQAGTETGFLSKKGSFDGNELVLGKDRIIIEAVLQATARFNRLILVLLQEDGAQAVMALAITKGNLSKLVSALNRTTSAKWARIKHEALLEKGQGQRFASAICPKCEATVDLTDTPSSPQLYCQFCDSISTRLAEDRHEGELHLCDGCGLFARTREFTIFYFYFLLVVYGWRYQKHYRCNACMKPQAWKMLFGNLPFVLGVPSAIVQIARVHMDRSGQFQGIDRANGLAQKRRIDEAAAAYEAIERQMPGPAAQVRFNHGVAFMMGERWNEAAEQLEKALRDCANFRLAAEQLAVCYDRAGRQHDLAALKARWWPEPAAPETAAA